MLSQLAPVEGGAPSKADKLHLAQKKVYDAWECSGKTRETLAKEALAISEECADAYLLLAEGTRDRQERIKLFRKAVAAGRRALGSNWEIKYKGMCWGALETRPVMRAMAELAMDLQGEDELTEALALYRKLMELNPNDNQGIRYLLAGCLYEAGWRIGTGKTAFCIPR
jgi:tetratricopeptide (TPR) repeat protein